MIGTKKHRPLPSPILRELKRLAWIGLAVTLLLSLASYSPTDPSWSTWSSKGRFDNWMGRSGSVISDLLFQMFGLSAFALVALIIAWGVRKEDAEETPSPLPKVSPLLWLFAVSAVLEVFLPARGTWRINHAGGFLGSLAGGGFEYLAGKLGAKLLALFSLAAATMILFHWRLSQCFKLGIERLKTLFARVGNLKQAVPAAAPQIPIQVPQAATVTRPQPDTVVSPPIHKRNEEDEELFRMIAPKVTPRPETKKIESKPAKKNTGDFQLPSVSMLSGRAQSNMKTVDRNWYVEKANILVQKLKDFGVDGEVVNISPGPVITVYEFKPASGVKIKEIANLSDDLTLALSVLSVRIVAPIPGKPVVGIEIPSPHREMVHFKDLIEETPFYTGEIRIPIVLGRLASGEPVVAGLATMPHLLVAGSTGTGKSVFINTMICSLLYRYTPQQLKLILVDPKMVELSSYEGVPHLLLPVVVDSKKAAMALRWAVDEMERRYTLMHHEGVRHIDAYNGKLEDASQHIPYIVVVIDEYADLMAVVPKDVELSIARLAQKARASGIHLVLATQRPSTDVVTGTIKANFPSRISFRVASSIDSKTILDRTGSERLLGNGDMLFHSAGFMSLKRMQGAFISDADIERVVAFLKEQGEPEYDEGILKMQELADGQEDLSLDGGDGSDEGRLYDAAVRLVADKGEASISLIQRHLKIGYNRAATLMEQLEKEGVVAQATGASKRRAVLVNNL